MMNNIDNIIIQEEEVNMLLDDVNNQYGFDFTSYSKASIHRRILKFMKEEHLQQFSELRNLLLNDASVFAHFVEQLTVNVTEMFRDHYFFKYLRDVLIPQLATYPFIRIWHAGCSTGEEVVSLAILMKEANLLDRALIYATDINPHVIEKAEKISFPIEEMKLYTENYLNSGGREEFSSYYKVKSGQAIFLNEFTKKIHFAIHNLVTDQSFNEFNLIICHNVLIYFNNELQNKVIKLFKNSLPALGYLSLGNKETLSFSENEHNFKKIDPNLKIWQKIK